MLVRRLRFEVLDVVLGTTCLRACVLLYTRLNLGVTGTHMHSTDTQAMRSSARFGWLKIANQLQPVLAFRHSAQLKSYWWPHCSDQESLGGHTLAR